ncbi:MAG: hypothetical protein F6K56_14745 [Moorea sp. SIO3G5]|nr:hypothetical protein [Moorena sp. SIO3G5]
MGWVFTTIQRIVRIFGISPANPLSHTPPVPGGSYLERAAHLRSLETAEPFLWTLWVEVLGRRESTSTPCRRKPQQLV